MKILLVKTSSLGDVVHTLTAVREAARKRHDLTIDWLVESAFADAAEFARTDGYVENIIAIDFRRWRKRKPLGIFAHPQIKRLKQQLRDNRYDLVIDAQGLLKSAYLAKLAGAPIAGFDRHSAREGIAALFYTHRYAVSKRQHAIHRLRKLFAHALDYDLSTDLSEAHDALALTSSRPLSTSLSPSTADKQPKTLLFFHGTTWDNKCYPTAQWQALAKAFTDQGYHLAIPQHGEKERRVAEAIIRDPENGKNLNNATVLPPQSIAALTELVKQASGVICVDTGMAHLAAYLGIPTVFLFGPTNPRLTGGIGHHCANLQGMSPHTQSMKRRYYNNAETFSDAMSAITVDEVLSAWARVVVGTPNAKACALNKR